MKKLFLLLLITGQVLANVDTLYINTGLQMMVDSVNKEALSLNESPSFSAKNIVFKLEANAQKTYFIINTDSISHELYFRDSENTNWLIPANDTVEIYLTYTTEGLFVFEDVSNYPLHSHLGLSGGVFVGEEMEHNYFWNLKEHDPIWIENTLSITAIELNNYKPKYFTINGLSHPDIQTDLGTSIQGQVGDLIHLNINNTGRMHHALHFHGYHVRIVYSSAYPHHNNRLKDSFNIEPMESIIVEIIPDKPGMYPIHDHNLGATIGNGTYANGMLTFMNITE